MLPLLAPGAGPEAAPRAVRFVCRLTPSVSIGVFEQLPPEEGVARLRNLSAEADEVLELTPYPLLTVVDQRRLKCNKLSSTYAYDFLHMFELAAQAEGEADEEVEHAPAVWDGKV